MNDRTEAEKANDEALALQAKATEAQAKALAAKADDAKAKAAELNNTAGADGDTTVADAKVLVPLGTDPELPVGDYRAVKRGNDPANPAYAPGVSTHPDDQTVRLVRVTADSPEPIYTWVHPDMVGNYLRAGWGRA